MWPRRDVYGAGLGSQQGLGVWAALAFLGWCSCHSLSFPQFYFSSPRLLTAPLPFTSFHFPYSVSLSHQSLFPQRPRAPRNALELLSTTLKPKQEAQSCSFYFLPI